MQRYKRAELSSAGMWSPACNIAASVLALSCYVQSIEWPVGPLQNLQLSSGQPLQLPARLMCVLLVLLLLTGSGGAAPRWDASQVLHGSRAEKLEQAL